MSAGNPDQAGFLPLTSSSTTAHATSPTEVVHIAIAFVILTADLVIVLSGRGLIEGGTLAGLLAPVPLLFLLLAIAACLTGFIAHEIAHKLVARRLGYWAEFRMWPTGLALSIITSLGGFLFAGPGATVVEGMDAKDVHGWGVTAVAGPVSNLLFAAGFYGASLATFASDWIASEAFLFLAMINTLFATFNLLPVDPLDGAKVLRWSIGRWAVTFAVAAAALAVALTAFYSSRSPFLTS